MKQLFIFFITTFFICSCQNKNAAIETALPSESIFNLSSQWHNQNNETLQLKNLNGKTLVVVMIYTSCKTACPILVSKMKTIEQKIERKNIDNVNLVLVSIDPETDTPDRLKQFAEDNEMRGEQWTFLTSNEDNTQEFANVLSMKYKKISPIDFSHSNIISVFNPLGQLVSQEQGTEINVDNVVAVVNKTVK